MRRGSSPEPEANERVEARKPFLIRIDPALHAELERWAQEEFRSVNGQIEYLLRQAVTRRKGASTTPTAGNPQDQRPDRERLGSEDSPHGVGS